jgi:hypothetical protein
MQAGRRTRPQNAARIGARRPQRLGAGTCSTGMTRRALVLAVALALGLPSAAGAQAPVVVDPEARQVTALGGTIVWVTGRPGAEQRLMQQSASGTRLLPGAPPARFYRTIDLGRDADNELVLTYTRCETPSRCVIRRDDLRGNRASIRGLALPGCELTTAPALWRTRAAYGLECRRGRTLDPLRSGLYVKTGSGAPRRMPRPRDAARFGVSLVTSVDLRGTRTAAVLSDIFSYAFALNVDRTGLGSYLAGASEGDSDEHANGLALGSGGALWSLTTSQHSDDPLQAVVTRLRGTCRESEILASAPGTEQFPAIDLAVDGTALFVVVPGTGIVRRAFAPARPCG